MNGWQLSCARPASTSWNRPGVSRFASGGGKHIKFLGDLSLIYMAHMEKNPVFWGIDDWNLIYGSFEKLKWWQGITYIKFGNIFGGISGAYLGIYRVGPESRGFPSNSMALSGNDDLSVDRFSCCFQNQKWIFGITTDGPRLKISCNPPVQLWPVVLGEYSSYSQPWGVYVTLYIYIYAHTHTLDMYVYTCLNV